MQQNVFICYYHINALMESSSFVRKYNNFGINIDEIPQKCVGQTKSASPKSDRKLKKYIYKSFYGKLAWMLKTLRAFGGLEDEQSKRAGREKQNLNLNIQ